MSNQNLATESLPIAGNIAIASESLATSTVLPPLPEGEEIYGLRGLEVPDMPFWSLLLSILVILAALLLVLRRIFTKHTASEAVPKLSNYEQAMKAIDELKSSGDWAKNNAKNICEAMTNILKNYLAEEFFLGRGDSDTSDEFLAALAAAKIKDSLIIPSIKLFEVCDFVRYTGKTQTNFSKERLLKDLLFLLENRDWRDK